ncbi:nuclear transport factor 2 family protein [Tahibacter amnicola]|uniref:Nuclear transport factor 2 family protein n=1 Tax=Tahibacter amnicola TaxID=2976241 RepID=A0ABY6BJN7_9GAMM|nr:nuclear transport factor 2 family protein [Tahibacter amnicola]UXI69984.1 nuclear transport factor 2 family protein [Tahibacter amnicola]
MQTADLLTAFYEAFQRRDGAAMAACYAPDATFRDPVFQLRGNEIGAMWTMLCQRGKDLALTFDVVDAGPDAGRVNWQARYTFSSTGRPVVNDIAAQIRVRDGKIVDHVDTFSFWRWSRQALGPAGLLLGWTPWLRQKVRRQAAEGLARFLREADAR